MTRTSTELPPTVLALVAIAAALGAGCEGCRDRKPYTPYTLASSATVTAAASAAGSAPTAAAAEDAGLPDPGDAGVVAVGVAPPGDGKSWAIDDRTTIEAPTGRAFASGLVADLDGDAHPDLLAWARSPDGLRGELVYATAAAPSQLQTIAAMPPELGGRQCAPAAVLSRLGARTAALDLDLRCREHDGRATEWIAVVALGGEGLRAPELRLELRLGGGGSPAPEVAVAAKDEDGDGRDDVTLTFTAPKGDGATPAPAKEPTAIARFFDRPAGLARDASEPEASLRAQADALLALARGKHPPDLAADAAALRRLHDLLCAEHPAVTTGAGPLSCGDGRAVDVAWLAEGASAIVRRDLPAAIEVALALDRRHGDAATRKELERALAKAVPARAATLVHRVAATPDAGDGALGPLRFETTGALLVRTSDGVVRVDPATFEEQPASDVPAWSTALAPGSASYALEAIAEACDPPSLTATWKATADGATAPGPVSLPLAAGVDENGRTVDACAPIPHVRATPIDVADGRLVLAVGTHVLALTSAGDRWSAAPARVESRLGAAPGTARSPDGGAVVLPTPRGLLVLDGKRAHLLTGDATEGVSACTAAKGGARVACLQGGAAVILAAEGSK